jgi:hypothetical protein
MVREGSCKGSDAGFWLPIYTCMNIQRLVSTPWRKPVATISTKRCIDTGRMYLPGFAVYITLATKGGNLSLEEMKNWLVFFQDAPENIRAYLIGLVWVLAALTLIWAILKLLFNEQFKELYSVLGTSAKVAGQVGKALAKGAAKSLELPEPYPRAARFFAIVFMINSYAGAFVLACFALFVAVLTVLSNTPSFWGRTGAMFFSVFLVFLAWAAFADAERDRVRLFRNLTGGDGG